jgi:hypothetical protein
MAEPITKKGQPGYNQEKKLIAQGMTPQQARDERLRVQRQASEQAVSSTLFGAYAQDIFDIDPSIRSAFNQIVAGIRNKTIDTDTQVGRDAAQAILRNADWAKQFGATARRFQILEKTDPGTAQEEINNKINELRGALDEVGGSASDEELRDMARVSLMGGRSVNGQWTPLTTDETRKWVARTIDFDGTLKGQVRKIQDNVRDIAFNYGFNDLMGGRMQDWLRDTTRAVTAGDLSVEDVEGQMKQFAIGRFPALAKQLQAGIPLVELVAPYKNTLAGMLEIDEESVSLADSLMERALGSLSGDGQQALMPLWEFKQQIRNDPRWLSTDQAVGTYNNIGVQIARDFGFL